MAVKTVTVTVIRHRNSIAGIGATAYVVGTFVQLNAGAYFALHGNWEPIRNMAISHLVGKIVPKPAQPSFDKAAENAIKVADQTKNKCSP